MRWLAILFVALIAALQYPMWLGKGGWLQVRELDRQLAAQRDGNARLKLRNDALDADVRDLKTGYEAIEERARSGARHDQAGRGVFPDPRIAGADTGKRAARAVGIAVRGTDDAADPTCVVARKTLNRGRASAGAR